MKYSKRRAVLTWLKACRPEPFKGVQLLFRAHQGSCKTQHEARFDANARGRAAVNSL